MGSADTGLARAMCGWIERLTGRGLAARLRSDPAVDRRVAEAMIAVNRRRFVRWWQFARAYDDRSLPTGAGTSTSQPTYIAKVISWAQIQPGDRVLEVGTGAGYTAAVLARLAHQVVTVECVPALAGRARHRLAGVSSVRVLTGDGCHVADGTYDAILVMAGAPSIPIACSEKLREGGRLVIPIGELTPHAVRGKVIRVTRRGGELAAEEMGPGDWNPLRGQDGWEE